MENKNFRELQKIIKNLLLLLREEYPARHYKHLKVFNAYWNLVDSIDKD